MRRGAKKFDRSSREKERKIAIDQRKESREESEITHVSTLDVNVYSEYHLNVLLELYHWLGPLSPA